MRTWVSLLLASALLVGCGSGGGPEGDRYLSALAAEQHKLGGAEQQIPRHPRTGADLAKSIALLHVAIQRLANDLAQIRPPRSVLALHEQLVAVARSYAQRLGEIERTAGRRDGLAAAADQLNSSTRQASSAFAQTTQRIVQSLHGHT